MKVLITGASGFLGSEIVSLLTDHEVTTLSRSGADIIADLSAEVPNLKSVDLVVHAAGKAHMVPKTSEEKESFYKINVQGTRNLLKALQNCDTLPSAFVFISSVAVYGKDAGNLISEDSLLAATDPYGKSKIQAEEEIAEWCKTNNVIYTVLRLPLIAGANPPGNLKAMVNGIKKGYYFNVAGGCAKKSIVLASDVAKIIPLAAQKGGVYNLTDGYHPSFKELSGLIASQLNKSMPLNLPLWLAVAMARAGDVLGNKAPINTSKLRKITSDLTFDDNRAKAILGWKPEAVLEKFKI